MSLTENDRKILADVASGADNAPAEVRRAVSAALDELDRLAGVERRAEVLTQQDETAAMQQAGRWVLGEGER